MNNNLNIEEINNILKTFTINTPINNFQQNNPYINFTRPLSSNYDKQIQDIQKINDKKLPYKDYIPPKDRMNNYINEYQFNTIFNEKNTNQSQLITDNFINTSNQMYKNSRISLDQTYKDEINNRLSNIDKIGKTIIFNRLNNQTEQIDNIIPKNSY